MINPELIAYIRAEVAKGLPSDVIQSNLRLGGGWTDSDIAEAFQVAGVSIPQVLQGVPVAPTSPPVIEQIPPVVVNSPVIETPLPSQSSIQAQASNQNSIDAYNASVLNSIGLAKPESSGRRYISKNTVLVTAVVLLILLGGGGIYALVSRMGLLTSSPYKEGNFISGLLSKASEIDSSAYTASVSVKTVEREKGAKPFTVIISNKADLERQYQNDSKRAQDTYSILSQIKYSIPYPKTLAEVMSKNTYYGSSQSIKDPKTGQQYVYQVTENGNNFELKTTYETNDAISSVRKSYGYTATGTPISNKTVTYTKSSSGTYLSATAPKPLLVTLQESAAFAPAEFSADASISATADLKKADWKFNVGASGDFGDLSYKVNIDFLRKDKTYYFRINNIPSIFLGSFPITKGEWVKIPPASTTPQSENSGYMYDPISSFANEIPTAEESYKKNREDFMKLFKKAVEIADDKKLVAFKGTPNQETVDNRKLYRYDLTLRKESIIPFYKELIKEVSGGDYNSDTSLIVDESLLDYLQSPEFDQVFDYVNENTKLTVWVDADGFPVIIEETMRLIPPDAALQLKDKQVIVIFKLSMSDINKNVTIDAPKATKTLEDIVGASLSDARAMGANASIKSNLANIRAWAEIYYDAHNSKYGTSNAKGSCTTKNTVFTDPNIVSALSAAQSSSGKTQKAVCYSTATAWALSLQLAEPQDEKGYWCVDSTGNSELVSKSITKASCR